MLRALKSLRSLKPIKPIEPIMPIKPIKPINPIMPIKPITPITPIKIPQKKSLLVLQIARFALPLQSENEPGALRHWHFRFAECL